MFTKRFCLYSNPPGEGSVRTYSSSAAIHQIGSYSASKQRFVTVVSESGSLFDSKYFANSYEECEPSTSLAEARENQVVSLLDRLKPPDSNDLSRKRKINVNRRGKGGNRRSVSRNEKPNYAPQVSANKWLEDFSKESWLAVSFSSVRLVKKKSVIKGHIASKKYSANKEKLAKAKKREMDIAEMLDKFEKEHHPRGETLPTGTRVYRVKIVQAFLKSGTPLNRLEYLRDIFQEAGVTFTYRQTCESLSLSFPKRSKNLLPKNYWGRMYQLYLMERLEMKKLWLCWSVMSMNGKSKCA